MSSPQPPHATQVEPLTRERLQALAQDPRNVVYVPSDFHAEDEKQAVPPPERVILSASDISGIVQAFHVPEYAAWTDEQIQNMLQRTSPKAKFAAQHMPTFWKMIAKRDARPADVDFVVQASAIHAQQQDQTLTEEEARFLISYLALQKQQEQHTGNRNRTNAPRFTNNDEVQRRVRRIKTLQQKRAREKRQREQ